jgi:hypothetical protein
LAKQSDAISPELADWLGKQQMFFVATAPLAAAGHVNCSPKGMDCLRVLAPGEAAYLDLTGSGAETIAHVRENGRIVLMFCAFAGAPKIVRLHGRGEIVTPNHPRWSELAAHFPAWPGARSIVLVHLTRVASSCGFGVPVYEFVGQRDTLADWAVKKGEDGVRRYQHDKNQRSLDGLPALDLADA